MLTVGQEHWPTVRLFPGGKQVFGDGRRARTIRVDAPERSARIGLVQNDIIFRPASAACRPHIGQSLSRTSGKGHFLEFAVREESEILTVRRPEWIARTLGTRQDP